MVEGARLESEYAPKAYPGFESLPLRHSPSFSSFQILQKTAKKLAYCGDVMSVSIHCNPGMYHHSGGTNWAGKVGQGVTSTAMG